MKANLMTLIIGLMFGLSLVALLNKVQEKTCPECKGSKIDELLEQGGIRNEILPK